MNGYNDTQLLDALFSMCDQKAAAALGEPPLDPIEQRVLLLSMLPRHIAYLEKCVSQQRHYNSPEARLVADIYQTELDNAKAWLKAIKAREW